ncbi:MAG: AF1514 family protein [Desulfomonilaceae bacterium]
MVDCKYITRDMLTNPVSVRIDDRPADFPSAKSLADQKAKELSSDPMLLAWFDRKKGTFSPDVICCGDTKPSWLVYADSRGADISVDVNDLDYVFVYKTGWE